VIVLDWIVRLWLAVAWLTMTAVVALLALLLWPFLRAAPHLPRRGIAPVDKRQARLDAGLLPPPGDGCGCCGQDCPPGELWCYACRGHVGSEGQPHDRTWYAMYGVDCPYTPEPDRPIEETRLMPRAEQRDLGDEDQVAEGLGMEARPVPAWEWGSGPNGRRYVRTAWPSWTTPLELLPRAERELWREAVKASL